jgi:hypothetical protein
LGIKQQNLKKPLLGGYPQEPEFQNSECEMHQVGSKDSRNQNFRTLAFKEEAVGVTQIYPTTATAATARERRKNFYRSNHVF